MKLTLSGEGSRNPAEISLPDERRALANLLAFLNPDEITGLQLEDFSDNRLPPALAKFPRLRSLSFLRCHAFESLPAEILKCRALQNLSFIKCANLEDIGQIDALPNLVFLQISRCEAFCGLPENISKLRDLRALDISYCTNFGFLDFRFLPQNLRILDVHGCYGLSFDENAARRMDIVSLKIQDFPCPAGTAGTPKIEDLPKCLKICVSRQSFAAADPG